LNNQLKGARGAGEWGDGKKKRREASQVEDEEEDASPVRLVFLWAKTECGVDVARGSSVAGEIGRGQ
jgi:hypothetical protein